MRGLAARQRLPAPLRRFATAAALAVSANLAAYPGEPALLNLDAFEQTFNESFTSLDISAHGPGTTWTAHTPWHGDFGDAVFEDPGPRSPFSLGPHGLRITATRDGEGRWHSGLIASRDRDGRGGTGFAQRYGYFEMRARLPVGGGTWPAFWLIGTEKADAASEIDVVEFYGGFPGYFHAVMHLFEGGDDTLHEDHLVAVSPDALGSSFNDFGVLIEKDDISFYFNRQEVWRRPTPAAFHQPFYLLADLAIGGGWPHDRLVPPVTMEIERITVFAQKVR